MPFQLGRFRFERVEIIFEEKTFDNTFCKKNNKSLSETLMHKRYKQFSATTYKSYANYLNWPLGEFLHKLKSENDPFYKLFLNKYGDLVYSRFRIQDSAYSNMKGVYAYQVNRNLKYLGRCKDSLAIRINNGHGIIHPKNCFLDGQATNCRINALITSLSGHVSLWLHVLDDDNLIERRERELIEKTKPEWNIQYV